MTARDLLDVGTRRLLDAGIENGRREAEWILGHVLGVSRSGLYADPEHELTDVEANRAEALLVRRESREPLAYVLGEWGFRRLTLKTDARALVPRPETEVVVERVLALLEGIELPRVLDIGVGTGAIALSVKHEHPDAQVTAVDVSRDALSLARENAERLGLEIELREQGVDAAAQGWDLVVSNPPYVETLDGLQPELDHEPRGALLGKGFHERIARAAQTRFLVFEVGDGQAAEVAETLERAGYRDVRITRDLADLERVVEGAR
ncbi:MAG: release factor glutamine methyltransferase [Gaiellaceae bacterium]|nr:release factor glutamine methyltransferase [Gaiellaceae bacterium]